MVNSFGESRFSFFHLAPFTRITIFDSVSLKMKNLF